MTRIATTHFDAYIKGTKPPSNTSPKSYPTGTLTTDTTGSSAPLLPSPSLTYAQQAARPAPPPPPPTQPKTALARKAEKTPPKARTDTRLFVRVDQDHPARKAGSFAMLTALKRHLGPDSKALREV